MYIPYVPPLSRTDLLPHLCVLLTEAQVSSRFTVTFMYLFAFFQTPYPSFIHPLILCVLLAFSREKKCVLKKKYVFQLFVNIFGVCSVGLFKNCQPFSLIFYLNMYVLCLRERQKRVAIDKRSKRKKERGRERVREERWSVIEGEKRKQRERERDRERERETERERKRQRETERERWSDIERERERPTFAHDVRESALARETEGEHVRERQRAT